MDTDLDSLKHDPAVLKVYNLYTRLRKEGNKFVGICPLHSERTSSFTVFEKDMLWRCFGCGQHGNVMQLLEKTENIPFRDAVQRVKDITGVAPSKYAEQAAAVDRVFKPIIEPVKEFKVFTLDQYSVYKKALETSKAAQDWLAKRGITMETARKLHLGFRQDARQIAGPKNADIGDKGWLSMPRISGDKVVGIHYRTVHPGRKAFCRQPGMATALFNTETISVFDTLYVVEGEMDTAVLEQAGLRSVSIPSASSPVTPAMKDQIMQAGRIVLAGDCDNGVGSEKMSKLWRELPERTFKLDWPDGKKDANQVFLETCKGDVDLFIQKMDELTRTALKQPMSDVYSMQAVMQSGTQSAQIDRKDRLFFPWKDVNDMLIILPGDILTLFATQTGTGKTAMQMNIAAYNAIKYNRTVLDWQCELNPQRFSNILAAHLLKRNRNHLKTEDYLEAAEVLGTANYYVGHDPMLGVNEAFDLLEAAVMRLSVDILIIDHINFLIRSATNEVAIQAEANKRLKGIAQKHKVIIICLAQPKKADNNRRGKVVQLQDLKGSATASDDVDGVLAIHRNVVQSNDSDGPARDNLEAKTKVVLLKARNKGEGLAEADLMFEGSMATFLSLDYAHQEPTGGLF